MGEANEPKKTVLAQASEDAMVVAGLQSGADGTRCSTVVIVEDMAHERHVQVLERRFDAAGRREGESANQFALTKRLRSAAQPALMPDPAPDPGPDTVAAGANRRWPGMANR